MTVSAKRALIETFGSGRLSLPINLKRVAATYGIEVRLTTNNYSGSAYIENGKAIAEYSFFDPEYRSRFTLAHEIGHILLGHVTGDKKFTDVVHIGGNAEVAREREANAFAAELLVPEGEILELVFVFRCDSIDDLCSYFNVSKEVIGYRLGVLGIIDYRKPPNYLYG